MILHKDHVETMGGLTVKKEVSFSIAPAAMKHVMHMLSNLYSDPYRAIAREYISNAVDAHRLARMRNPNVQLPAIKVHIPSQFDPTFRVRDFGPSMTVDETAELLSSFGASGDYKRESDLFIGAFGAGSKSGFAVSDTFSFTVFRDGRKRVWICTTRDDAARALQMVSDVPTDEPDGVEVSVPIKHGNEVRVRSGVEYVMYCINEEIDLGAGAKKREWTDLKAGSATLSAPVTPVEMDVDESLCSYLIHGDFIYPIDATAADLSELPEWETFTAMASHDPNDDYEWATGTIGFATRGHCFLRFPAGTFRLSPSRESLIWDEAAKSCVQSAINDVVHQVRNEAETLENAAETPIEFLRIRKLRLAKGIYGKNKTNRFYYSYPVPIHNGVTYTAENIPYIDISTTDANGPKKDKIVFVDYATGGRRGHHRVMLKFSNAKGYPYIRHLSDSLSDLWSNSTSSRFMMSVSGSQRKTFTLGRYKYVLAEQMKQTELEEAVKAVYTDAVYTANERREIMVIVGDEAFRKAKLVEMAEWLDGAITDRVLTPPPKAVRSRTTNGTANGTDDADDYARPARVRKNWVKIDKAGVGTSAAVDPGATVVNLGGVFSQDNAVLAYRFIQFAKMFVPELKNAELYSLTVDQLKRHNREPQCKIVYNWHEKFYEWINIWAQSGMDEPGLGFEVLVCSGNHYGWWVLPSDTADKLFRFRNVFGQKYLHVGPDDMLKFHDLLLVAGNALSKADKDNSPIERLSHYLSARGASLRDDMGSYGDCSIFKSLFNWMRNGKHNPYGVSCILSEKSRQVVQDNAQKLVRMMEDVVFDDINAAFFIEKSVERAKYYRTNSDDDVLQAFYQQMKLKKFPPPDRVVKQDTSDDS